MDFENRRYRPLDMQRYHQTVNVSQLAWVVTVAVVFFGLTCLGEPLARKSKNGTPILPANTPAEQVLDYR